METGNQLVHISDLFYKDKIEEGMNLFLSLAGVFAAVPALQEFIDPVFDALERADYLSAADLIRYKMLPLLRGAGES